MVRRTIAALALLTACGTPARVELEEPEKAPVVEAKSSDWVVTPNQPSKAYGNDDGVLVEVVPVSSKSDPSIKHHFLIRATGSHSEYDGLVVLARWRRETSRLDYVAQLRGEPYVLLHHYKGAGTRWIFAGYEFSYRSENVQPLEVAVDADKIIRLREEQKGSESRKLEPANDAEARAAQDKRLQQSMTSIEGPCGKIPASIDWSTVEEQWTSAFSIAIACDPPIAALQHFCAEHPHRVEALTDAVSLTCRFRGLPEDQSSWHFAEESPGKFVFSPGGGNDPIRDLRSRLRVAFGEDQQVMRLGKQLFIFIYRDDEVTIYTGEGTTFYPAVVSSNVHGASYSLPSGATKAELDILDGKWRLQCGFKVSDLETLVGAERQAILDGATFEKEPKWKRVPYFLSRDSRGTYYYVDRYQRELGGKRYRVFVGRRGQLKLTKLERLVEDSEGTLFSTTTGDLRLVVNSGSKTAVWIQGKKETPLTPVAVHANRKLIFDELGVYYGDELGLVCD